MLNEITLLQAYCLTSWFTCYSKRRSIKFDVHNDNDTPTEPHPFPAYCQYWLVIVYSHIPVFPYVVYISYTPSACYWRIHHLIFYTAFVNPNTPSSTCNSSKIIRINRACRDSAGLNAENARPLVPLCIFGVCLSFRSKWFMTDVFCYSFTKPARSTLCGGSVYFSPFAGDLGQPGEKILRVFGNGSSTNYIAILKKSY